MKNAVVYLEDKKIKEIYMKLAEDMKNRRGKKKARILDQMEGPNSGNPEVED